MELSFLSLNKRVPKTETSVFWHLLKTKILTTRFPVPRLYTCLYGELKRAKTYFVAYRTYLSLVAVVIWNPVTYDL